MSEGKSPSRSGVDWRCVVVIGLVMAVEHDDDGFGLDVSEGFGDAELSPFAAGRAGNSVGDLAGHGGSLFGSFAVDQSGDSGDGLEVLFVEGAALGADGEVAQLTGPEGHSLDPGVPAKLTLKLGQLVLESHAGLSTRLRALSHSRQSW
jgi:hypothetical protein